MDNTPLPHSRSIFFYIQRTIGAVLLLALAATFIYSGYSKIYSENAFDNFQWTFLDLGISSILAAGIIARLMIGLEFMLGLLLIGHVFSGHLHIRPSSPYCPYLLFTCSS